MKRKIATKQLVFFDLETGGTDPETHPIIQIGAVSVNERIQEIESFEVKIRFHRGSACPAALSVNSFEETAWEKEAVSEREAAASFSDFLKRHTTILKHGNKTRKAKQTILPRPAHRSQRCSL